MACLAPMLGRTTDEPGREQPAGDRAGALRPPRRCRIGLRTRRACPPCRTFSKRSLQPRAVGPTSSRRAAV